jgi:surface antigen
MRFPLEASGASGAAAMGRSASLVLVTAALLCGASGGARAADSVVATEGAGRGERLPEGRDPAARDAPPGMPTPLSVFTDQNGRLCHLYERPVSIGGETATAYATLCRQPNGRWVLVQ